MAKVLIVDGEKSICTTLAKFIREKGHDVFTAEDAAQALQLLVEEEPAVVVTDITLPRMTGVALLKRINEIALEEIEGDWGVKFDPKVVDACLKLLREGEFVFLDHAC